MGTENLSESVIDSFSYNELRACCKEHGLPATGKAVELRERLKDAALQGVGTGDVSVDAAHTMDTAMKTPLPDRRSHGATASSSSGKGKGGQQAAATTKGKKKTTARKQSKSVFGRCLRFLFRIIVMLVVVGVGLGAYCGGTSLWSPHPAVCGAVEQAYGSFTKHQLHSVAVDRIASAWNEYIKSNPYVQELEAKTVGFVKRVLIQGVDDVLAIVEQRKQSGSGTHALNPAVLESLIGKMRDDDAWRSVVSSLEDVWSMKSKISENKGNVVLFACTNTEGCAGMVDDLSAVAPPSAVLKLEISPSKSAVIEKGEIQRRIATFLREHPRGVVIIPHVERWPYHLVSVLNNALGESGSLVMDGGSVKTHDATYLLTIEVPASIVENQHSAPALTLSVKSHLQKKLIGNYGDDDIVHTISNAFRRRIDVVAYSST
jgi:hypothetical protein